VSQTLSKSVRFILNHTRFNYLAGNNQPLPHPFSTNSIDEQFTPQTTVVKNKSQKQGEEE